MDKLKNLPATKPNPKAHKTMGKRNKNSGYVFEVEVKDLVKDYLGFPNATLSRMESITRDREKVDIMNQQEGKHGRIPWNFQCKNVANGVKLLYPKILDEMPKGEEMNIILHNHTVKEYTGSNIRFRTRGQFAITYMDDMFKLLKRVQNLEKGFALLNEYFDSISKEEQAIVALKLEALGL